MLQATLLEIGYNLVGVRQKFSRYTLVVPKDLAITVPKILVN
jgi:hypothetical protein